MNKLAFIALLVLVAGCTGGYQTPSEEARQDAAGEIEQQEMANETAQQNTTPQEPLVEQNRTQQEQQPPETVTYTVLADDNGFYREDGTRISSITIAQTKAKIKFKTTEDVYYGGLDFKSAKFNSPKVPPQSEWTSPEFEMDTDFEVKSYWPSSGVLKAVLTVKANQS
ncbi:MAG: hypothetical protein HYS81_00845 [Candidatus Aenigmatarchaeota archaeon]|nr:MAG: hypothetical protein HYS81_00845 [Candidatus Aenigmarchaeota archaeon]